MNLYGRILSVGDNHQNAMGNYHPVGTGATPMVMPLHRVIVTADAMGYDRLQPLIAPDGAPIPAVAPGTWGQVVAAGRP